MCQRIRLLHATRRLSKLGCIHRKISRSDHANGAPGDESPRQRRWSAPSSEESCGSKRNARCGHRVSHLGTVCLRYREPLGGCGEWLAHRRWYRVGALPRSTRDAPWSLAHHDEAPPDPVRIRSNCNTELVTARRCRHAERHWRDRPISRCPRYMLEQENGRQCAAAGRHPTKSRKHSIKEKRTKCETDESPPPCSPSAQ